LFIQYHVEIIKEVCFQSCQLGFQKVPLTKVEYSLNVIHHTKLQNSVMKFAQLSHLYCYDSKLHTKMGWHTFHICCPKN